MIEPATIHRIARMPLAATGRIDEVVSRGRFGHAPEVASIRETAA